MAGQALELKDVLDQDQLAVGIANSYQTWEMQRNPWLSQKQEIQEYIFATDTSTTTNSSNPWKNSTHVPKLCQIRDNLHANYMAALFPNDRPIKWEGDDETSETLERRKAIESYVENKMRTGGFKNEISKIVLDWIDYGNCYAFTEFIAEYTVDPATGEKIPGYVGPKVRRLSPLDLVYNITAPSFEEAPKIIRSIKTLGSLRSEIESKPECGFYKEILDKVEAGRHRFSGMSMGDFAKSAGFSIDGFGSWFEYFTSDYVELLDFYGDIYDTDTGAFLKNQLITVVDRSYVIRKMPNPSWIGKANIFHCGWRLRPDNLVAMGPLDNLIGMQYRIDHLENAKADAFDLIIHPVIAVTGFVEDFEYGPGERIYMGDEGKVEFMRPDTTMLNADTQIALMENKMEEMAGAPKQAMGFRTPGEKTAFEVQILENGSNRIFLNKTAYFEEQFLEPLLNSMLEIARRNMEPSELIRVMDDQYGVVEFMKITREDIAASGKIRPIGARHFLRNANTIQNLVQMANSPFGQDASVTNHISGKKLAKLMEELLDLERYDLVQDNIRVAENLETAKLMQAGQQIIQEAGAPTNGPPMVQPPPQGQAG